MEEMQEKETAEVVGAVSLVYEHHSRGIQRRLDAAQHAHPKLVVSSLHVHLDGEHCLEVVVLRGRAKRVRELAAELTGTRGVLHHGVTYSGIVPR